MKGIFIIGQDKSEARLLKDIALTLHEEFDSIEIRYPGAEGPIEKDSLLVEFSKNNQETTRKSNFSRLILTMKDLANVNLLRKKVREYIQKNK